MTTASNTTAYAAVRDLNAARAEIVRELLQLSEDDCTAPAVWAGIIRNVNFMLRAYALHELDHLQHIQKLLRAQGWQPSEAQILLAKAQALRAETETLLMSLSDAQLDAPSPEDPAWSIRRIVAHLAEVDQGYLDKIRAGLAERQSAGPAS